MSVLASPSTNILTELSGESNTGAERAAFQLTNEFLTLMLDPFLNGSPSSTVSLLPTRRPMPERVRSATRGNSWHGDCSRSCG